MKKTIFIVICFTVGVIVSCTGKQNTYLIKKRLVMNYFDKRNYEDGAPDMMQAEDKNNCQFSCVQSAEGYEVILYDKSNRKVFSEIYPREPWIRNVTDNILEIGISVGSPARYTFYFDKSDSAISRTYFNPILIDGRYIAYMETNEELIITDIFNKGLVDERIKRDFSVTADPVSAIINIEMFNDESIILDYLQGPAYVEKSEIIKIAEPDIYSEKETESAEQSSIKSADDELFVQKLELLLENNRYENFNFQEEEKAICIYEGIIKFDLENVKFAVYKETAEKDIIFVNMLFIQRDSGRISTWKGEDLVQIGIWENSDFQFSDVPEGEIKSGLLYEDIAVEELLDKVMEVLKQDDGDSLKLIYDGSCDFLNKKYYMISSFNDFEDHLIRIQTYYVDVENGNIYQTGENSEFLRTELFYAGSIINE